MIKKSSISFNWFLSMCNKVFLIFVPLITTPYISRVLGAEGLGVYTYCLSYSSLFIVLGQEGIPIYGKRTIAISRNKKDVMSNMFWEMFFLEQFLLIISCIGYFVIAKILGVYWQMFLVCSVGHIAALFDISWFFEGIEDFKTVVLKNVLIKVISVICIFHFVKSKDDMYLYALCLFGANVIGNISLWGSMHKYIRFKKPIIKNILKHIKPSFFLLLPCAIIQLFEILDKSMLGYMCADISEVAYYEQGRKIVSLCMSIIMSIGIVIMPRLSTCYHQKDYNQFKKYLNNALDITLLLSIAIAFGCSSITSILVPWFFGKEFNKVKNILVIASPLLVMMGINDFLGLQILSAMKKEKVLMYINIISIIFNLIFNAIFIPKFLSIGAMVATVIAEFIKCIILLVYLKDFIHKRDQIKALRNYLFCAISMFCVIKILYNYISMEASIANTLILICVGAGVYGGLLIITKNKWITFISIKINMCFHK